METFKSIGFLLLVLFHIINDSSVAAYSDLIVVNATTDYANYTSISDFRVVNRRFLYSCPSLNPNIKMTITPDSNLPNDGFVTVTIDGIIFPSKHDWVGMLTASHEDVKACPLNKLKYAQTGDVKDLPLLCHYPMKAQHLRNDPGYLKCKWAFFKKKKCSATLTFHVVNVRTDIEFVLFGYGYKAPCVLRRSNPIRFANPKTPMHGHISSVDSSATSMKLTWVSADSTPQYVQFWSKTPQLSGGNTPTPSNTTLGCGGTTVPSNVTLGGGNTKLPPNVTLGGGITKLPPNVTLGGGNTTLPSNVTLGGGNITVPSNVTLGCGNITVPSNVTLGGGNITVPSKKVTLGAGNTTVPSNVTLGGGNITVPSNVTLGCGNTTVPSNVTLGGWNTTVPSNVTLGGNTTVPSNVTLGGNTTVPSNVTLGCGNTTVPSDVTIGCGNTAVPSNVTFGCGNKAVPSNVTLGCGSAAVPSNVITQLGGGNTTVTSEVKTFTQQDMCTSAVKSPAIDFGWHDPGFVHSAVMTGLQPSTTYTYRYGSDLVGWSDNIEFRTPPASGADSLNFISFGDYGKTPLDKSDEHYIQPGAGFVTEALKEEVASGKFDSIFHIGDISYATGFLIEWDFFLHQISPYASKISYMTAIGNHERDYVDTGSPYVTPDSGGECGVPYETYFPMPTSGKDKPWYSIEQGPVHFTVISSEHEFKVNSEQHTWINSDLASVNRSRTPWVIFMSHRPLYASIRHLFFTAKEAFGVSIEPLLLKYKVDLALVAHVHSYERTCAVYQGKCMSMPVKDQNGVDTYNTGNYTAPVHALIGMAGFNLDFFNPENINPWSLARISEYGYARFNVTRTDLIGEFVNSQTRQVRDRFRLTKNPI